MSLYSIYYLIKLIMSIFEKINTIDVVDILYKLWIRYKEKQWTYSLIYNWKQTDWWKASRDWKFTDFSEKWRPEWDRVTFVMQYLWISKKDRVSWYEREFNIKSEYIKMENPIKEKRDNMLSLSQNQIDYLEERKIDYNLLWNIVKNNNWKLCLPIKTTNWEIKSLQSRAVWEHRYYVEANTDSDWIFMDWLDDNKKSILVVEWFSDFLSLRQYTTNVVWLLNAKNEWQIRMIKDLSTKYKIFFIPDNDEAWLVTVEKFDKMWIKYNLFKLSNYWVKDINELLCNTWLWKDILTLIWEDSEKPLTNIQLAIQRAKEYQKLYKENWWHLWFSTWYPLIDECTDWFIRGKIYMIMAYSNVGKTRFAYSLIRNMIKEKKKVHFYSLEVDTWMLLIEIVWALKNLTRQEVMENLDWIDYSELEEYIEMHDDIRTLEQIESSIKNDKPDIAVIDFIQNIEHIWSEYEKMTDIALKIQKLWIITWTTIIQLSQVSNESRFADWADALPKWSWALFASSDVIFTLWGRDWKKFLTISKNKYWKAWVNFILNIDYATSTFHLRNDLLDESRKRDFKWFK